MIKKLTYYIIGIALTGWAGYMVIWGITLGGFALFHTICLLLGIALIWKAHTVKAKHNEKA